MEEAPENGKESLNSAHANGMSEMNTVFDPLRWGPEMSIVSLNLTGNN
jgi:hypothetical protein